MEFLIQIIAKLGEYTIVPVSHQLGYIFHCKRNLDKLRTQIEQLSNTKSRLQHSVDYAKRKGEEIEDDVQEWLSRVAKITEEAEEFLKHETQATSMGCSRGSFMNLVSRRWLSRKAKKMAQTVDSEIQCYADRFRSKVSFCLPLQSSIETNGFETFETRAPIVLEIKEALRDPNVRMIGVYGMAGVGKTMLAKEVARQALEENLFSQVVIVTVSQTPSHEKIQEEVAEHLGLALDEKTVSVRANRLRHRLEMEKKILLILDDVWEKLNLHDIGIWFGDDEKGCKILMTSRFRDVLCNDMNVEKKFHVNILSDGEAIDLFKKIAGDSVNNYEIQALVNDVVAECARLPIAIATVANTLKNENSPPIWKDALQELRMSSPNNIKGMHEKVYTSIKMSYNFQSEEAKSLLLLCSLHEEDANINVNYLLRYCMGLDWFDGITKLDHARNRVLRLVEDLKSSCLLQDGDYIGRVKIHDVIRDVVVSVASEERNMYNVRNVTELEELLTKEKLMSSTAISLLEKKDDRLPERLECPQLKLFLLRNNRSFHSVPDNFFEGAKQLKVLDLAFSLLEPLPSSFCFLQNLQTLCLFNSKVGDISLIGDLKNLEILDLSWSNVEQLPKQVGQLNRLRLLDLRFCSKLEVIQPNVIASLTRLEELNMESSFTKWEVEPAHGERKNASLFELKNLLRLTALHVCILDVNILPENLFTRNLERYKILVGDSLLRHGKLDISTRNSRILKVKLNESSLLNKGGLRTLLEKSEELYIDGLEGVNNVVYELDTEGFSKLKCFEFANNAEIKYIIKSVENNMSAFQSLELLCLDKLINLEKICHGKLTVESFGKLRVVKVRKCPRLKNLLSFSIARHLEVVEVIDCKIIEKVITYQKEDHNDNAVFDKIDFPQLRSLCLEQLPELSQFFSESIKSCSSGTNNALLITKSAVPFFIPEVVFPRLEYLKLSTIKSDDQNSWTDQLTELERNGFPQLKHLIVENITDIRYIISSTNQFPPYSAFLNLESLYLDNLTRLEKICNTKLVTPQSFCKLKNVKVSNCDKLKNLFSLPISANVLVQLGFEEIEVNHCQKMEEIISFEREDVTARDQKTKDTKFKIESSQLRSLRLRSVPKLLQFCSTPPEKREPLNINASSSNPFFNGQINFPKLETLEMCSLNFPKIWDNSVLLLTGSCCNSFRNLTTLLVKGCGFLKVLLPSSVAANLVKLRLIDVRECNMMEEIISRDREDTNNIIFHKLYALTLTSLPKLTRLCTEISIEFPDLFELSTTDCPHLNTLIVSDSITTTPLSFFNEKVALPNLVKLNLTCMDSLTLIWQRQIFTTDSLKVIKIYNCKNLKVMFPSHTLERLEGLRRLEIRKCDMLEEVFEAHTPNISSITFLNLQAIVIYGCPNLKSLFPAFVAKGLIRLEKLEIKGCGLLEIVSATADQVGPEDTIPRFIFPQLTSLQLRILPQLLHFYPRMHTSEWPLLKKLNVQNCGKLRAFALEFPRSQEASGTRHLNTPTQPVLFSMEKVTFPNLEELTLGSLAFEGVIHGTFKGLEECARLVSRLTSLQLSELPNLIKFVGGQ